jgi:hypothetical protein
MTSDSPPARAGIPIDVTDLETLTPCRPRRLRLNDRAHWIWMLRDLARTYETAEELRQLQEPYTPRDVARVRRYIAGLGPFETRESVLIDREMQRLLDMSELPLGGATFLGIESGAPDVGKTTNIGMSMLLRSAGIWLDEGQRTDEGHEHWPYAYVEANSSMRGPGLLKAMLGFFTPISDSRADFDQLLKQVSHMLEKTGNVLFVVDDAHHIRQTDQSTATLTNHLKTIVSRLPTSLVFVGNELEESALLKPTRHGARTAAEQLRARMRRIRYPRYTSGANDGHLGPFTDVMRKLETNLIIRGQDLNGVLTAPDTIAYLIDGSSGRVGTAIKWVKQATADAISKGKDLTPALLEGTKPDEFAYRSRWSTATSRQTT